MDSFMRLRIVVVGVFGVDRVPARICFRRFSHLYSFHFGIIHVCRWLRVAYHKLLCKITQCASETFLHSNCYLNDWFILLSHAFQTECDEHRKSVCALRIILEAHSSHFNKTLRMVVVLVNELIKFTELHTANERSGQRIISRISWCRMSTGSKRQMASAWKASNVSTEIPSERMLSIHIFHIYVIRTRNIIINFHFIITIFTCTALARIAAARTFHSNCMCNAYDFAGTQPVHCKIQFACRHLIKWNNREIESESERVSLIATTPFTINSAMNYVECGGKMHGVTTSLASWTSKLHAQ